MPNLDGTGPHGKGPKTGRALGKCGKSSSENDIVQRPARKNCKNSQQAQNNSTNA